MKYITSEELEKMEVINLCDGSRLGCPSGVELDVHNGCLTALIIPKDGGFFSLGRAEQYRIPWCHIQCIGEDAILVKLDSSEQAACLYRKGRK